MNPDINNIDPPDWLALGGSVLFFIALCIPMWVRITAEDAESMNFGAQWGWVAIIGVIAVWGAWVLVMLGVELPFQVSYLYLGGGGLTFLMTALMLGIRPLPDPWGAEYEYVAQHAEAAASKLPYVSAYIAIAAIACMVGAGLWKLREERSYASIKV